VGLVYASLLRGHVLFSPIYNIVYIIFVNYIVNSKYLADNLIVFGKHVYCKKRTKMQPQLHL